MKEKIEVLTLDLKYFGLSDADLQTKFTVGSLIGIADATLQSI